MNQYIDDPATLLLFLPPFLVRIEIILG